MKAQNKNINLLLMCGVLFFALILTLPFLSKIPNHGDETAFFSNAFRIMSGEPLQNYYHVAATEYILAGFLTLANLFSNYGINFPGEPSAVTYYYARVFCFVLYLLGFIFGAIILQKNDRAIKLRTVIFSMLYFSSIGIFERFLRVNSDVTSMLIYFNFVILSCIYQKKPSIVKSFILNASFIFLESFTNFKSIFLILPLVVINLFFSFTQNRNPVSKIYIFIIYNVGIILTTVILWTILMPKPFDANRFWNDTRGNIAYSAKTDLNYPQQSYNSWKFYLYDTFIEYIGLFTTLGFLILLIIYAQISKNKLYEIIKKLNWQHVTKNLYHYPELILSLSMLTYYFGISLYVVHFSRWGLPLGLIGIMLLSILADKIFVTVWKSLKVKTHKIILILTLLVCIWILRLLLVADLVKMNYDPSERERLTRTDVEKFLLNDAKISLKDQRNKAAWILSSYTKGLDFVDLGDLKSNKYKNLEYALYIPWSLGTFIRGKGVDLAVHNQEEIMERISESVTYRFPTFLSYYAFLPRYVAWKFFGITYDSEIDLLVEPAYAIAKLKHRPLNTNFTYSLNFNDLAHYYSPNSKIFNLKTITSGSDYIFPRCFNSKEVRYVDTGMLVSPLPELGGIGGQTAGLYCHSIRFRFLFKGNYKILVRGLPEGETNLVYASHTFNWDSNNKTIELRVLDTEASAEVGIATKERFIKDLNFLINYSF